MLTVTAETSWASSVEDAWAELGRRASYLCFPGLSPVRPRAVASPRGAVTHALALPIVDPREQVAVVSVSRAGRPRRDQAGDGVRAERRFAVRGDLVSIAGCWHLEPAPAGVRARLTLHYEIAEPLKTEAVHTLRSRSPLPIRTDADAILSRAVDEFFETRFAEHAATYCERTRERLDSARP